MKVCPQCEATYEDDQRFCSKDGVTLRPMSASDTLVGTTIADRYHVLRALGEGGMGQVYLAEHVRIKRLSAVKVIRPKLVADADAVTRFVREATNASRIDHPNVAAIHDFGETPDGLTYLAMEFVDGEPLSAVLAREGPMAATRAAAIVSQVADALEAAHELGIVHRDLKPDNIMLARQRDGRDRVKVVDFGIAKMVSAPDQAVTATGLILGTPAYMSPEQVGADPVDGRSDEFALALVAVKLLTGDLPFSGSTTYELLTARLTTAPRRLAELRPDVRWPESLEGVLRRALATNPADRYATVTEFARAFADAANGQPAPHATTPLPVSRPMGPSRRLSLGIALAIVLAAAGAIGSYAWQSHRADSAPPAKTPVLARDGVTQASTVTAPPVATAESAVTRPSADTVAKPVRKHSVPRRDTAIVAARPPAPQPVPNDTPPSHVASPRSRRDSVFALGARARQLAAAGDTLGACAALRAASREAFGAPLLEQGLRKAARRLACR